MPKRSTRKQKKTNRESSAKTQLGSAIESWEDVDLQRLNKTQAAQVFISSLNRYPLKLSPDDNSVLSDFRKYLARQIENNFRFLSADINEDWPALGAGNPKQTTEYLARTCHIFIGVGQDAAGLRGSVAPEGAAIREGTRVHLVPVDREQANNVLRYSETLVKSDGSFALTNIAPARYFILARVEAPTEMDTSPRPSSWDAPARAKLRREAETANTIVELKPCERVVDYTLKPGG